MKYTAIKFLKRKKRVNEIKFDTRKLSQILLGKNKGSKTIQVYVFKQVAQVWGEVKNGRHSEFEDVLRYRTSILQSMVLATSL